MATATATATAVVVLPVIDLAKFDAAEREKLAAAAAELGCFRVVNHGMPAALQAEMRYAARSLFDIPAATKLCNAYDSDIIVGAGYIPPHTLSPFYESLGIFDAASPADVRAFCSSLDASPPHREIICEYMAKLHGVAVDVGCRVAESLGLVESRNRSSFEEWLCNVKLNCYNYVDVEEDHHDEDSIALLAHTDSGFIAIIQEDDESGGLEIMMDGKFVPVDHPSPPGTFLINIGDVGKAWSNGRLHSVKHRVVVRRGELGRPKERMTMVMFMISPRDGRVEPHASLVDSQHPRLYKTFDYMEYRKNRNASGSLTDQLPPIA